MNSRIRVKKPLIHQSTESADGGGCQKFYRPLEIIGIYPEISLFRYTINFSVLSGV